MPAGVTNVKGRKACLMNPFIYNTKMSCCGPITFNLLIRAVALNSNKLLGQVKNVIM